MKSFFNLFLTLTMPISILFILITTIYYKITTVYSVSESAQIALVTGVTIGISLSFTLAFLITLLSLIRKYILNPKILATSSTTSEPKITLDPTIYKKKAQSTQKKIKEITETNLSNTIEEKILLLVNKELAYELSLNTIKDLKIYNIIHQNKEDGFILLKHLKIIITPLTKHTSEVLISTTQEISIIQEIVSLLKKKEHTLLKY